MESPRKRRLLAFFASLIPSIGALYCILNGLQKSESSVLQFRPWGSGTAMVEITTGLFCLLLVTLLAGRFSSTAFFPFFIGAWFINISVFFSYETWLWQFKATIGWSSFTSALTALTLGALYSCWLNRLDSPYSLDGRRMPLSSADMKTIRERLHKMNTHPEQFTEEEINSAYAQYTALLETVSEEDREPNFSLAQSDSFASEYLLGGEMALEEASAQRDENGQTQDRLRLPGNRKSWLKGVIVSAISALALLLALFFQAGMVETDYQSLILQSSTSAVATVLVTCAITFGAVFLTGSASMGAGGPLTVSVLILVLPSLSLSIYDLVNLGSSMGNRAELSAISIMGPVTGLLGAMAFIMMLASLWAKHSPHNPRSWLGNSLPLQQGK